LISHLSVEDDVFRGDSVLGAQRVPGTLDVGVQVLLRGLAGARAVPGVIVTEDVTIDSEKCKSCFNFNLTIT